MRLPRPAAFSIVALAITAFSITAYASDDAIVGRWVFPMDQDYTFKENGIFTRGYNGEDYGSGTWKFLRVHEDTRALEYSLSYNQGRNGNGAETVMLSRGDHKGHEYQSGYVLRLNQRMPLKKKLEDGPTETIRNFYGWYVTQLNANDEPTKDRALMARYITRRFLDQVERDKKKEGGLGSDPFIVAQDVDDLWAKNIFVSHVETQGDRATAQVWLKGKTKEMERRIKVSLVNERGWWKIDSIEARD